jgi:hypothetical protein
MAPFHEAINIRSGSARGEYQVYTGAIDSEWTVGAYVIQVFREGSDIDVWMNPDRDRVPHGGQSLQPGVFFE